MQVCVDTIGRFECRNAVPTSAPSASPTLNDSLVNDASAGSDGGWMPSGLSWARIIAAVVVLALIAMLVAVVVVRKRRQRKSGRASMASRGGVGGGGGAKDQFENPVFVHPAQHGRARTLSGDEQEFAVVEGALEMMRSIEGVSGGGGGGGQSTPYVSPTETLRKGGPMNGSFGGASSPPQLYLPHTSHAVGYTNHSKVRPAYFSSFSRCVLLEAKHCDRTTTSRGIHAYLHVNMHCVDAS